MKRKNYKKIILIFLSLLIMLQLVGCSSVPVFYTLLPAEETDGYQSNEAGYKIADTDLGIDNMQVAAEDAKAVLYFNPKTTEIAVKRKDTGMIWYSNPQDRTASTDALINAQIVVTTLDRRDTEKTWDTYTDSVQYGQFTTEPADNGITVNYLMGKKAEVIPYPAGLTADRYNEIVNSLQDDKLKGYMKRMYGYVEYDKITSGQTKDNIKAAYPKVEELNTIYVIKGIMTKLEKKNLTKVFDAIGYTDEMRQADEAAVGYVGGSSSDNYTLSVTYSLDNGSLTAEVDPSKIKVTQNLKITQISILRNFGAQKPGEKGYLFVPDGSGAIINTNSPQATVFADYNRRVYGQDYGILRTDRTEYSEQLYLPVFGAYNSQGGFIGIAEKDDGQMSVQAGKATDATNYGYVYSNFLLLSYALVTIESSSNNSLNLYPRKAVTDPIKVRYLFSDKENTGYDDLAVLYRDYMTANGQLDGKNNKAGIPVMANAIGAIDDIRSVLGYPVNYVKALTDYKEVEELAADLKQKDSKADVVIGYTGWLDGGIRTGYIKKADLENKLGSKKEFEDMIISLKSEGVTLMPVVEQQYVYNGKWYQGFNPMNVAIRFITRDTGYKPEHNIANYYLDANGLKPYILRPEIVEKNAGTFTQTYDKYGIGALSVGSMATELYSDFYTKQILSENDTIKYFKDTLGTYKNSGNELGGYGANAYTLSALDYAYGLPVSSSNHPIIERSVPFLQIVLSGSVSYTMPALNTQSDPVHYLLKAIETGSGVYFDYFAADGSAVKDTNYDSYYAASRDSIYALGQQIGNEVSSALAPVANQKITSHREIAADVFTTTYANGISIGVNYTNQEYDGIPALGYAVMK